MPRKKKKPLTEMTVEELARETAAFEDEFVIDTFAEPDAAARRRLARAKRKRGRPRRGKGVKVISLTMERELLKETDLLARKLKVSRSRVVEISLRRALRESSE